LLTQWHPVTPHDLIKQDVLNVHAAEPVAPPPPGPERRAPLFRRPSTALLGNPLARGSSALSRRASQVFFGGGKKKGGHSIGGSKADAPDELGASSVHSDKIGCSRNKYGSCDTLVAWRGCTPSVEATESRPVLTHAASTPLILCADPSVGRQSGDLLGSAVQPAPLPRPDLPAPSHEADGAQVSLVAADGGSAPAFRSYGLAGGQATSRDVSLHVPQWHGASDERPSHPSAGCAGSGGADCDGTRCDSITIDVAAANACPSANPSARAGRAAGGRLSTFTLDGSLRPPSGMASAPRLPPRLSRVISFDANDSERRERLFRAAAASRALSNPTTPPMGPVATRESAAQSIGEGKPSMSDEECTGGSVPGSPSLEASCGVLV
jgi:hypothetical protein